MSDERLSATGDTKVEYVVERVHVFDEPEANFMQLHNGIFDAIMPLISANAWKVLCFIIRQTRGYRKTREAVSYGQIMAGTGIASGHTISAAVRELEEHRLIVVKHGIKRTSTYALNRRYSVKSSAESALEHPSDSPPSTAKNAQVLVQKVHQTSAKSALSQIHTQISSSAATRTCASRQRDDDAFSDSEKIVAGKLSAHGLSASKRHVRDLVRSIAIHAHAGQVIDALAIETKRNGAKNPAGALYSVLSKYDWTMTPAPAAPPVQYKIVPSETGIDPGTLP